MEKSIAQYFEEFNNKHIVVIGDVMIDRYIVGDVNRISPEAPVPVLNFKEKDSRLGGAANVALNINALGAKAILCSVIGKDVEGEVFLERAEKEGISCQGVVSSPLRKTTIKTRIIAQNQQLLRIDEEQTHFINENEEEDLILRFNELLNSRPIDAVIFEDYNKGVLTPRVIKEMIDTCNKNNIITTVDPKKEQFFDYQNVTLFKPNLKELREGIDRNIEWGKQNFERGIIALEERLHHKISMVTLSENGVYIKDDKQTIHLPAHVRNISDVSGAGDTVISTATLCLTVQLALKEVATIANLAGGIVCEEIGVVPVNKQKLLLEAQKTLNKDAPQ